MKSFFVVAVLTVAISLYSDTALSQPKVHPAFTRLTETQVRNEFANYEEKGKRCAQEARERTCEVVTFSPEQPLEIPVQGLRGVEAVNFLVSISTPRARVRERGYRFGRLWPQTTGADRVAVLRGLVMPSHSDANMIVFTFRLISKPDLGTSLPSFHFAIVNANQRRAGPSSQPDFNCPKWDLSCQVAMEESGVSVSFPLFLSGGIPFFDNTMVMARLIVAVGETEKTIDFDLNALP